MSDKPRHKLVLERLMKNRVQDEMIRKQVDEIIQRGFSGGRGDKWYHKIGPILMRVGPLYEVHVTLERENSRGNTKKQIDAIIEWIERSCGRKKYGDRPWIVTKGGLGGSDEERAKRVSKPDSVKDYGSFKLEAEGHFDHIYDREPQIQVLLSALELAQDTSYRMRHHTVLYGPPGCGKTEILLSVANMLGDEHNSYMKLDATSMTEAGVSKILLESAHIPPVCIIEEVEKAPETSLRWLLGVLDKRAEIRRTNYRIGNASRHVPMVVLATVNDMRLFRRVHYGALASRFSHQVYCPRPSRDVVELILRREIKKLPQTQRNEEWIEPTLQFCVDEMDWNDPRKIIPVCLSGRDRLLDGTYQEALRKTMPPTEIPVVDEHGDLVDPSKEEWEKEMEGSMRRRR